MSGSSKHELPETISRRITLLRFPLIVGVVFIHAYGMSAAFRDGTTGAATRMVLAARIQDLVSQVVARVSVPLFFAMSAFLLFHGMRGDWGGWRTKLKSRCRSLLVPYLLWNAGVLSLVLVARRLPSSAVYFSAAKADPLAAGVLPMLGAAFGLTDYPIAYQFWFIRDLMVLVMAAPLLWTMLRHRFAALAVILLAAVWWFGWPKVTSVPAPEATVFFLIGGGFGAGALPVRWLERGSWLLMPLFGAFAAVDLIVTDFAKGSAWHMVTVATGTAAVWLAAGRVVLPEWLAGRLTRWSALAFFVFAAHEPLLTVLKKASYRLLQPASDVSILAVYVFAPVGTIVACLWLGGFLTARAPRLMGVLTGSREARLAEATEH